ncbi:MAG: TnsA endonuclease N-terminal domain-containing protein [Candidatus Hermodarchaeota archaeon]
MKKEKHVYFSESSKKTRKIPLKTGSYRGEIVSIKLLGESPTTFPYESRLERDRLYILDHDINYKTLICQPLVEYVDGQGENKKVRIYHPDTYQEYIDGTSIYEEVKPFSELQKLLQDEKWVTKMSKVKKTLEEMGAEFKIVTELEIRTPRLENILLFREAAQHPPKLELVGKVKKRITLYLSQTRLL